MKDWLQNLGYKILKDSIMNMSQLTSCMFMHMPECWEVRNQPFSAKFDV
jgi:hypothetical protein